VIEHASGCPIAANDPLSFTKFLKKYPWTIGLIMIIAGPIIALYGRRFFPWVIGGIVFFTTVLLMLITCSYVGALISGYGILISVIVSAIIGALVAWFSMKRVWISIAILGVIGGYIMGSMLYTMYLASIRTTKNGSMWVMLFLSFFCAIIGGLMTARYAK